MSFQQEKDALFRIISNLKQFGWEPWELDDGGDEWIPMSGHTVSGVVEDCSAVDMCTLRFRKCDGPSSVHYGAALIVWGNSPEDLIADATMKHGFNEALDTAQHAEGPHLQL